MEKRKRPLLQEASNGTTAAKPMALAVSPKTNQKGGGGKKKARYSKAKKRELKELRLKQEENGGSEYETNNGNRKKKNQRQGKKSKKISLDDIDRILKCAEESLFTNSIVVENNDEVSSNTTACAGNDGLDCPQRIQGNNLQSENTLAVTIVSGCDVSSPVKETSVGSCQSTQDPLALSSLGHRILMRRTTIKVQPLLILDLNGILCHRDRIRKRLRKSPHNGSSKYKLRPSVGMVAKTPIIPRPKLLSFLQFLDQHFCLAIWTSAKPKTAKKLLNLLLSSESSSSEAIQSKNEQNSIQKRLLFVWSQRECTAVKSSAVESHKRKLGSTSPPSFISRPDRTDTDHLNGLMLGGDEKSSANHSSDIGHTNDDMQLNRKAKNEREQDDHEDHSYDESIVFEKHLPKVWEAFPLWSQDNTLLIDDSPEKCPLAVSNAVHPPPLHGRQKEGLQDVKNTMPVMCRQESDCIGQTISDEENEAVQALFFQKLVEFWKTHPHTSTPWTARAGETVRGTGRDRILGTERTPYDMYYQFLETHAKDCMRWRSPRIGE